MNKNLFVFSILLVFVTALVAWGASEWLQASFLMPILIFLFVSTWLVFVFMSRKANAETFIKNYLLSIVLKLLAGGVFIAIVIFVDNAFANSNAILFMAGYLLLTGLEVGFLFNIHNKG